MKRICAFILLLFTFSASAGSSFIAERIHDGSVLSITISDDHLIPPFEAGELWKIIKGNDYTKIIPERTFNVVCTVNNRDGNDISGNCRLLVPYSQFSKIGKYLVFKAQGEMASRLNSYFIDSAYYSIQGNQVYLSSYNTRRLFYFGINEDLIH